MKKVFALLLALTLALSLAACGGKPNDAPPASGGDGAEDSGEQVRVACILSGPISDMSWNYTAHADRADGRGDCLSGERGELRTA